MIWQRPLGRCLQRLMWHGPIQLPHVQVDDLANTIEAVPADAVVVATPMDLHRLIHMSKPSTNVA